MGRLCGILVPTLPSPWQWIASTFAAQFHDRVHVNWPVLHAKEAARSRESFEYTVFDFRVKKPLGIFKVRRFADVTVQETKHRSNCSPGHKAKYNEESDAAAAPRKSADN